MSQLPRRFRVPLRARYRAGFSSRGLVLALIVVLVLPAIAWSVLPKWPWSSGEDGGPMMHRVERGHFIHDVTERGEVESASNVEITSKVKSGRSGGSSGGIAILSIVPEGTVIEPEDCLPEGYVVTHEEIEKLEELQRREQLANGEISPEGTEVEPDSDASEATKTKPEGAEDEGAAIGSEEGGPEEAKPEEVKPGEAEIKPEDGDPDKTRISPEELRNVMILVKLDSSALENQKVQQEIVVYNSDATVIQAQNVLDAAQIALKEYRAGQYVLDERAIQSEILLAEENYRRAKEYYEYSRGLLAKGYVTERQLEADKFARDKAENDLASAKKKLEILRAFTKEKMEKQLAADIKTAEAKLAAAKASYDLDVQQLNEVNEQIANCTVFATSPGQVVYANREGHHGMGEVIIEEGTMIREHQVIIRLPDRKRMQVEAQINEARVKLIKKGMQAIIELDAIPGVGLEGTVEDVAQLPGPSGWWNGNVKTYDTIIKIHNPGQLDLRPGYNAMVKIRVEELDDVLQVPVQAIIEHGPKYYCVLRDGEGFRAHEVKIGSTNDKFVVIEGGLEEGQEVVLNAAAHREELDLPKLAPQAPQKQDEDEPTEQFNKWDRNGDGRLQADELPDALRPNISVADTDEDGTLDRTEFNAAMAKLRSGGGPGRVDPGSPPKGRKPGTQP